MGTSRFKQTAANGSFVLEVRERIEPDSIGKNIFIT